MSSTTFLVIVGLAAAGLAVAGLLRPFLGVMVLFMIHFIQPGELIPALAAFNIERYYGIAVLAIFLLRRPSGTSYSVFSNKVVLASFLLVGAACLSIPFSVWPGGALTQTIELIKDVILLVLLAGVVDTNDRLQKMLWVLVVLQGWFAWTGFRNYLHGDIVMGEGLRRAMGESSIVGGPNELAGLIVTLLPFLVVILQRNGNSLVRLLLLASAWIGLATAVLTGSRMSMICLLLVLFCYIVQSSHKIILLFACTILALTVWTAMPKEYRQRYLTVAQYAEGAKLDDSNRDRLEIWYGGWAIFKEHPIFGIGAGEFQDALHIYSGKRHGEYRSPHSLLVEVGCELGIVGLVAFGYFVSQIAKSVLPLRRLQLKEEFGLNYRVAQACGIMLLTLVVMSSVGHTLFRPYWYLLGALVAANRSIVDKGLTGEETLPFPEEETAENLAEPELVKLFEEGRR